MHHSWSSLFDSTQNRVHVHFAQKSKAVFEGMKHTNSLTIFAGTSTFAITPLSFSPPTFINFSLVVMSVTWEKIPGSPRFSILQATEAGQGLGTKLSVCHVLLTLLVNKTVLTSQVTSLLPNEKRSFIILQTVVLMFAFYVKRLLMSNLNLVAMLSCVTSVHKEPRSVQPARYLITNNAVNFFFLLMWVAIKLLE